MAAHLVMFLGRPLQAQLTQVEKAMDGLMRAAASSTLKLALATGLFDTAIIVTNDDEFIPPTGVELRNNSPDEFQFGRELWQVVKALPPEDKVVYVGAGAGALLSSADWRVLLEAISRKTGTVTANNYFSADLVGWQPAHALLELAETNNLPDSDNNLAWALCHKAGLEWQQMLPGESRNFRTIFDIDTPTDGAILKQWLLHQQTNNELSRYLATCKAFDSVPTEKFVAELGRFKSEVIVMGRVSGGVHRLLEKLSHGQTRVLSEERGMRASGREMRGEVRSLAGFMLDELGPEKFFERLSQLGTAVAIDSRILFAHQRREFGRGDRFNSDAFQPEAINDQWLREFTRAARQAQDKWGLPVILGGHSLVAGDLLLLLEMTPPRYV